jgi:hypothetical protein
MLPRIEAAGAQCDRGMAGLSGIAKRAHGHAVPRAGR